MAKVTYKDAGVDLDVYRESMSRIPRLATRTFSPRVLDLAGGFAGLFQLDFESPLFRREYQDPVLVACTDGVGTKLKVATVCGEHRTVGIDLVAMCVNDAICCGAEPLFFLDYVAMSHDDPDLLEQVVEGISNGCREADCALLGGETAIMPDLYSKGEYDLAGFCVGVVERRSVIDGNAIAPGDCVLGVASSGIHSNGYSLVRKVVFETAGLDIKERVQELEQSVGDILIQPTRIYARPVRQVLNHYRVKNVVHGMAHITGGGLLENLGRIVPDGLQLQIQPGSWDVPPVFPWLQQLGEIPDDEMNRVFNMGLGLVMVVSPYYAKNIQQMFQEFGLASWVIGEALEGEAGVVWK
jgi:phosphoribosylformylglycinamidine cyclo-ligase